MRIKRVSIIYAGCFLSLLLISFFLYFIFSGNITYRVLFFPKEFTYEFSGELRRLPKRKTVEENIHLVVDELILGPIDIHSARVLSEKVKLNSILFRNKKLYLDFSPDIIITEYDVHLSFNEILEGIKKTLIFNFPDLDEIIISVGGET